MTCFDEYRIRDIENCGLRISYSASGETRFVSHIAVRHKQNGFERSNEMDLEEKSQTIVDKIKELKSDDGRSPCHTESVRTDQHHFDLKTRDGHILKIRVHEDKEVTTVFIDSETLSIEDGIKPFDHPNQMGRQNEVVKYIRDRFI